MVYKPSVCLVSAVVALTALQMQFTVASPLKDDLYTSCTSYNIGDDNFPGRGSEIEDDGTCTVIVPKKPKRSHSKRRKGSSRKLESATGDDISDLEEHFDVAMELKLKNLPTAASMSSSPWSGGNWLAYLDGINYEWNEGQPSPAEKYAKAFGLDVKTFMDDVSAQNGIDSMKNRTDVCMTDNDCYDSYYISCVKRPGASSGNCLTKWVGMGHGWAAAAILEKEPNCPVTYNGVTFQPMDIKALVTDIYATSNISSVFAGSRFNGYNDSIGEYGRHTSARYRSLNPGLFHIAAANLLGLLNTSFIIDRETDAVVWNQPVVGFEVQEQTSMTAEEAARKFYNLDSYPWNVNASSIVHVTSNLSWVTETLTDGGLVSSGLIANFTFTANYTYLLELNNEEEIIGGEWLYDSNDDHPDFMWLPEAKPKADTASGFGLSYANVTMLLEKATVCSE